MLKLKKETATLPKPRWERMAVDRFLSSEEKDL